MCKELTPFELETILNNPSIDTVANVVAENTVKKGLKTPIDLMKKIYKEPAFQKQKQLCVKIIESIGGHYNEKELPKEIKKMAEKMGTNLDYNSDNFQAFAGKLREFQNKPQHKIVDVKARTFS